LRDFAQQALARAQRDPGILARVLGEYLTEPKSNVWFETAERAPFSKDRIELDRRTKMMFDDVHIFINGEGFRASGRDATLMKRLADDRSLDAHSVAGCSADARGLLASWVEAGWIHER
jgi:50S ribosomal protein L16 3-hydroxylase